MFEDDSTFRRTKEPSKSMAPWRCNVALGGGCGVAGSENVLFALFLPTKSAKKEQKGFGAQPQGLCNHHEHGAYESSGRIRLEAI